MYTMLNLMLARLSLTLRDVSPGSKEDEEKCRRLIAESVDYAQSKVKPHYIIDFIEELPQIYITVLIATRKILERGEEYATFEAIYEAYRQYQKVNYSAT